MEPTKAQASNYRKADDLRACLFCIRKQAVPFNWCDQIGQQVRHDMTCDQHKEAL